MIFIELGKYVIEQRRIVKLFHKQHEEELWQ